MSSLGRYLLYVLIAWLLLLTPSFYYLYNQLKENKVIDDYLSSNGLYNLSLTKESALRVAKQVREDFNSNESSFVVLDLEARPFLREDTYFLLTHREGLCGEGTRVIVNLLNRLGFDATRITLFDKNLKGVHTLVSVVIDGKEVFVDSLNVTDRVNMVIDSSDISTADFGLLSRYSDNVRERRGLSQSKRVGFNDREHRFFFSQFWLYSYEAIPYSKFFSKAGLNVRAFNFERPGIWLTSLAEKPNLLMACIAFIISLIALALLHKFKIIRRLMRW